MSEAIIIKIILLHLVAVLIVCFLGMMTVRHTTIQKCLLGIFFDSNSIYDSFIRICNN